MKTKFNSDDDDFPSKEALELRNIVKVVRSIFYEGNKCYPQCLLNECLYKLRVLEYDRISVSKGIDINKTGGLRESIICLYWYFFDISFRF